VKEPLKFWQPEPGEEVILRMTVSNGITTKYWNKKEHGAHLVCTSDGTFDTSLQCFGCAAKTGIFLAALLTLFLVGPEAASAYYRDSNRS